jgi:hypothetical protein
MSFAHAVNVGLAVVLSVVTCAPLVQAQTSAGTTTQIVLGATVGQRHEAARALVPLLRSVKTHAQPGVTVKPDSAPNSKLTGRPSTLFAFTVSRRSVPVDPRVVAAMDRLLAWNIGGPATEQTSQLFDRWLIELEARSTAALKASGGGLCGVDCIVARMTTLNETWGPSPKGRADARDELLLDAMRVVVLGER